MKILFATHDLGYADHISFAYLSAVAKERGHKTYFATLEKEKFNPNWSLRDKIAILKPDIVAYSCNLVGYKTAVKENYLAGREHKFISIMGGPQATFSPETFHTSGMDVYCRGEGEWAFKEFLERVEHGKDYSDVPNLFVNPVRNLIENLDDIPMPDRDLVLSNSGLGNVPKKTFYATRGCPYSCTYCANSFYHALYKGKGKFVRRFGVDRLIEEIRMVKRKYRMEFVKFGDDVFAMHADDWLERFCKEYRRKINVPFNAFLRIDSVEHDLLELLKHAGCHSVHLSVDSVSPFVREKVLGRQMRSGDIEAKLNIIRGYGIETLCNYMLAAPDSTLDDDLGAIDMSRNGNVTYSAFSTTVPMKGTALHKTCAEKYFIPWEFDDDMGGTSKPSQLTCFTFKEKAQRYNIWLLGPIAARVPYFIYRLIVWLIKNTKPNKMYRRVHDWYYKYSIENKIFTVGE